MVIKFGNNADNTLNGTAADDHLYGLGGDDTLYGRDGDDELHGGSGDDDLYGGRGVDTAVFSTAQDVDASLLGSGYGWAIDLGFDRLYAIENIVTGSGDDTVAGSLGANLLSTGAGYDDVFGDEGDDEIDGGAGNDDLQGGFGDDHVRGGAGNDYVGGDEGDDVLEGNAGNDDLDGHLGVDIMTGGTGADDFFLRPGDSGTRLGERDVITDFSQAQGDRLEVYFFDPQLEFIGTAAFSAADQVRYVQSSGSTFVQFSTDADTSPEMVVELTGTIDLAAADFVFV
ncbi:MAG: calcium-binding protein [Geminicoccaceae bacterium]